MSEDSKICPKCYSTITYPDRDIWVCSECFHEWTHNEREEVDQIFVFKDALGNVLVDGDSVTIIKDLKVGGKTLKSGMKVKNIKLLDEPVNDHDIFCKISGVGALYLKSSVVKKNN